jgi:integrase
MTLPHYWTPGQVKRMLDKVAPGPARLYALLLWRTGLRRAEALALRWSNILLTDPPMLVVQTGKGGKARMVPIHPDLAAALGLVPRGRLEDRVFRFSVRTADRIIRTAIVESGLDQESTGTGKRRPSTHSLRHSAARHWLNSGRPVNQVSAWLGHSNPKVTLDTYLPLSPGELSHMDGIE